jgi:hypothetical protein
VRLVKRVCDTLGPDAHLLQREGSFPEIPVSWESHMGIERPVQVYNEWYLEPREAREAHFCLVNVNVEVLGLMPGQGVWICGEDEALGGWLVHKALPLARLAPAGHGAGGAEAQQRCLWWALVRLPSNRNIVYKYFVAPLSSPHSSTCWEGTSLGAQLDMLGSIPHYPITPFLIRVKHVRLVFVHLLCTGVPGVCAWWVCCASVLLCKCVSWRQNACRWTRPRVVDAKRAARGGHGPLPRARNPPLASPFLPRPQASPFLPR